MSHELRLFIDSGRLDECDEDPPVRAFEHTYYTQWQILYAGELALELDNLNIDFLGAGDGASIDRYNLDSHSPRHDSSSLDNGSGDIHSSSIPIPEIKSTPISCVDVSRDRDSSFRSESANNSIPLPQEPDSSSISG